MGNGGARVHLLEDLACRERVLAKQGGELRIPLHNLPHVRDLNLLLLRQLACGVTRTAQTPYRERISNVSQRRSTQH